MSAEFVLLSSIMLLIAALEAVVTEACANMILALLGPVLACRRA